MGFVGGGVALVQRFLGILRVFLSVIVPPTVHSHQSPSVTMIGLPATTLSQLCSLIRASPFTPRCPVFYVGSTEFNLVYVGVGNETCRCVSCRTSVNPSGWKAGRRSLRGFFFYQAECSYGRHDTALSYGVLCRAIFVKHGSIVTV